MTATTEVRYTPRQWYHLNNRPNDTKTVGGVTYLVLPSGSWKRLTERKAKEGRKNHRRVRA